jgi:hypothetical protein
MPQLIKLRQIEASKEAIKKWDGHLPRFAGGNGLPFIGLKNIDEKYPPSPPSSSRERRAWTYLMAIPP